MSRTFECIVALVLLAGNMGQAADSPGVRMFSRLQGLEGDWSGTYKWSGARSHSGEIRASFYQSGNGSAIVENLIMDGKPVMSTVYHLDGNDLRMTHFCAAKNQPRLKATEFNETKGEANFTFIDVTNLASPSAGYVEAFKIIVVNENRIVLEFTFGGGGPRAVELIELTRTLPPAKPS